MSRDAAMATQPELRAAKPSSELLGKKPTSSHTSVPPEHRTAQRDLVVSPEEEPVGQEDQAQPPPPEGA